MKKIITAIVTLMLFSLPVNANSIEKVLSKQHVNSSAVSISVKNADTGEKIYSLNDRTPRPPASTLKVFTSFPSIDALGDEYEYTTYFYVNERNLYVKLGADPVLTSQELKSVIKGLKNKGYKEFSNIYIDSSITDNVEWGVGWMWDDGTNSLMPKYSAYNLDGNLMKVSAIKDTNGVITLNSSNPIPILNALQKGNTNNIYAIRHDWYSPDVICITGTLANDASIEVPINNMQRYYETQLMDFMKSANIKIANKTILYSTVPQNAKLEMAIAHRAYSTMEEILKNSNNFYAENLAKIAGGVKTNSTANLASQLNVFYDYWNNNGVNTQEITIADASGVSRNDLLNVDFMTNALNVLYNKEGADKINKVMAQPGEGTLSERMLNYRGSLHAKTGTLSNISGITGYITAKNGKTYSFAILIQNFIYPMKQIKAFENEIIEKIYNL